MPPGAGDARHFKTQLFVETLRQWVDAIEENNFAIAYRKALDLHAVGTPLAEGLPIRSVAFGPGICRDETPSALLEGLVGFLVAATCEMERRSHPG